MQASAQGVFNAFWFGPLSRKRRTVDRKLCVFDASAKLNGISLNSRLLRGPDLLTSLVGVLLRFRRFRIAISA